MRGRILPHVGWLTIPGLLIAIAPFWPVETDAQGQQAAIPAANPRTTAPKDLTGYWVSVITGENWHVRMVVPPKGEFRLLPLNAEARRIANQWDPAKDTASGDQCKSYGAANIMRVPGRLHIQWADDNTLRIDSDSGMQTRLLHFGASAPRNQPLDWQGYSVAVWEPVQQRGRTTNPGSAYLRVTTRRMRPGYLRKNGVPYSENATLEEYFDPFREPNGDSWLVVTSRIIDPTYLDGPYISAVHFKKQADGSGWDPTPCRADEAR